MHDQDERSLQLEQETFQLIEKYFDGYITKLAPIHKLDAALHAKGKNGQVRAFIEVKRRDIPANAYPSLMISFSKCVAAQALLDTYCYLDVKVCFFWHCRDKLLGWIYNPAQIGMLQMGGREDRDGNGGSDVEPVVYIDTANMFEVPHG